MASGQKRGILKKDGSMSASRGRAVWNETNLAENEQIKAELNTTKIDEPKTPYHAPVDADIDMEPLDLNNSEDVHHTPPKGGAEACVPSTSQLPVPAPPSTDVFENARQQHYSMKDALKRGKALIEVEDLDEEDVEGGTGTSE